jgi:hypothetical protein
VASRLDAALVRSRIYTGSSLPVGIYYLAKTDRPGVEPLKESDMTKDEAAEREGSSPLTTRGKPTKFTPERLQQIINLVERGKSRDEIADILDVPAGSLQVTCSRLGISLRRPKISNGVCFEQKRKPLCENVSLIIHHSNDHDGRAPLQRTQEQSQGNSQSEPAEPALIATSQQERANKPAARSTTAAIRFQYGGMERTDELSLTVDMIGQLALEAALRRVSIGELIAELITAMVNKDL